MTLNGKRVLILGGTSGIGLAVAHAVLRDGGTPVVASRRDSSVQAALASLGTDSASGATVDLADDSSIESLLEAHGPFDHLVYTAGEPLSLVPLEELSADRVRGFLDTRLIGALAAVRVIAPALRAGGSVTLVSGSAAERPSAGWALGAIICGAIDSLVRALALEIAPVRVNAVAPGIVRSPLWAELPDADREAMYSAASALPVGRVGEVEDVAKAFVYLMDQGWGTGNVIGVDGGTVLV